jgi:hypothetical protein
LVLERAGALTSKERARGSRPSECGAKTLGMSMDMGGMDMGNINRMDMGRMDIYVHGHGHGHGYGHQHGHERGHVHRYVHGH